MSAVFKREMRAYFTTPIGYIVLVIYALMAGLAFVEMYGYGVAQISYVFSSLYLITMLLVGILTMRLFSEERRQKTDQSLFTAPVKLWHIVLGKFFAPLCMFAIANILVLVFELIIAGYVKPDWLSYISCLLGTLLMVSAMIAIGVFISALTESQIMAAICTMGVSIFLLMLDYIASIIGIKAVTVVANWLSFSGRFNTFIQGIIDYSNIAFFLSITGIFLFLTVRVLESRRWS